MKYLRDKFRETLKFEIYKYDGRQTRVVDTLIADVHGELQDMLKSFENGKKYTAEQIRQVVEERQL